MSVNEKVSLTMRKIDQYTRNARLTDIQRKLIVSAITNAEIEWLGLNDKKRECVRCANNRDVGFIITINHYTKKYQVCNRHIKIIEDYIEGKSRKFEQNQEKNQLTLLDVSEI